MHWIRTDWALSSTCCLEASQCHDLFTHYATIMTVFAHTTVKYVSISKLFSFTRYLPCKLQRYIHISHLNLKLLFTNAAHRIALHHFQAITMSSSSSRTHQGAGRLHTNRNMANEIMSLIDEHLAWQLECEQLNRARRGSAGTFIVDWDGTGDVKAFHRTCTSHPVWPEPLRPTAQAPTVSSRAKSNPSHQTRPSSTAVNFHRPDLSLSTTNTEQGISVTYSPTSNTAHGHDPASSFTYDYNGRTIHVHRDLRHEYFDVPVETYVRGALIRRREGPVVQKGKKRGSKVVRLVHRVLHKLDEMGVMGRMRREREEKRRKRTWEAAGYVI
jgi:hypothetical protein